MNNGYLETPTCPVIAAPARCRSLELFNPAVSFTGSGFALILRTGLYWLFALHFDFLLAGKNHYFSRLPEFNRQTAREDNH